MKMKSHTVKMIVIVVVALVIYEYYKRNKG